MNESILKKCLIQAIESHDFSDELQILETVYGSILRQIQEILQDEENDDFTCVEKIIILLERNDFSCGNRHDFL